MTNNILDTISSQDLGIQLQQARKQRGLTQADAAKIIDVARTTLTAIEKGERRVTANELITLARAYGRQVSDFVHERPIIDSFQVQFRSSYKRSLEDDEKVVEYINNFEELCRDYLELEKIVIAPFPLRYPLEYQFAGVPIEQAAEGLAQEERNRLGIGDGPVPILRDILEQEGVRIFYIPMEPSHKFSAMYTYDRQLGACIAVNILHPEERRRMSLAHDYAHFLAHRHRSTLLAEGLYQRQPESERFADYFSYHFFMPSGSLTRHFNRIKQMNNNRVTPADLCTIANYYGVSVEALALRLEDLKLLPSGKWNSLKERGFKVQEVQKTLNLKPIQASESMLPKRYISLAVLAYKQELITEGQFAKFLRIDRLEARRVAEQMLEQSQNLLTDTENERSQALAEVE